MAIFDKPKNLNGAELIDELAASGINVSEIIDLANGTIQFDTTDITKANEVVEKHNGTVIAPKPTINEKLASVGLNLDDLKAALGL